MGRKSGKRAAPKVAPSGDKRAVKRRAKEISEAEWAGAAVRKAVTAVEAINAAMMVTMAAATAASAGSN